MDFTDSNETLSMCREILVPMVMDIVDREAPLPFTVMTKGKGNFATSADLAIEAELKGALSQLVPGSGFVAEESGETSGGEYSWIIDPIDGTGNYIAGLPYASSVALKSEATGKTIMGVVYDCVNGAVFFAADDAGAYVRKADGVEERIVCAEPPEDREGIAIFGVPYDRSKADRVFAMAVRCYEISSDMKRIGPSSLDICLVASGHADLYFELDLSEWDIAAGALILEEAGGSFMRRGDLCAFSSKSHEKLKEIVERHLLAE